MRMKNCPFCGYMAGVSKINAKNPNEDDMFTPRCLNQFCIGSTTAFRYASADDAVTGWNYRVFQSKEDCRSV